MPRPLHLSEPSDEDGETLYTVTVDRPTGPSLIGIIVRDDDYTVIHWPDGETSWPVINHVALPAEDVSDVDAAWARALEAIPEKVELVFVQYDDGLTDEQIQKQFNGEAPWDDSDLDEFQSDQSYGGAIAVIEEYVDAGDIEILKSDTDPIGKFDELRLEVQDRDQSDPFSELLRRTSDRCFRYYIGVDSSVTWQSDDAEIQENVNAIAEAIGADPVEHFDTLRAMLTEGYDGPVYVYWYGDVEQLVKACNNYDATVDAVKAQTITWTNPHLLILNGLQGSGMDAAFPGTITLPFKRENLKLDAKSIGNGYSWDDVAGIVRSAYTCEVTITENTNEPEEG